MSQLDLKCDDIIEIFRDNLKAENKLMSVQSLFLSERFSKKVDYRPYFQRNYVWDEEKATYFIESMLIGTEIPPIVLFQSKGKLEVIDGRQRYETLWRFLNDKFSLKEKGLHCLTNFVDKRYSELPQSVKDDFENTKLRVLQFSVVNEPILDDEKEDRIKKEIFRRYNSGIVPLNKEDVQRAAYITDSLTNAFMQKLNTDDDLYEKVVDVLLPKSRKTKTKRDKITSLLSQIRRLLAMMYIPIYSYAHVSSKDDVIRVFYNRFVSTCNPDDVIERFENIIDKVCFIKARLSSLDLKLSSSNLLYDCCFWVLSIMYAEGKNPDEPLLINFCNDVVASETNDIFWRGVKVTENTPHLIFEKTGSHYYMNIVNRYLFISNYFSNVTGIDFNRYLKNGEFFQSIMDAQIMEQYDEHRLHKPDPASMTIEDIITDMNKSRFLVRPPYQRSEVSNEQKASYLLESIMLGMCIPPIYVYRRNDRIKEVVDGQQRLLAILGFLGKPYLNEDNQKEFSTKNGFKLRKLRILKELEGLTAEDMEERYQQYIDRLWDFQINVVEIDAETNSDFNCIDLFLRLNSKPYPIQENSFEMWNAYADKEVIISIREIAKKYASIVLRPKDTRMRNEELLATMAYMHFHNLKNNTPYSNMLNIYIKNRRLCARISQKQNVTKLLSDISSEEQNEVPSYLDSVKHVGSFLEKLSLLCDGNVETLNKLMGQRKKGVQARTDQNYYFLWLILDTINNDHILENKNQLYNKIRQFFLNIQDVDDSDASQYLNKQIGFIAEEFTH